MIEGEYLRAYILDNQNTEINKQLLSWLYEKSNIEEISLIKEEGFLLNLSKRESPDIVFIRLKKQDLVGIGIGEHLHELLREVNIVFISESDDCVLEAFRIGASGYLIEPIDRRRFESCYNKLCGV